MNLPKRGSYPFYKVQDRVTGRMFIIDFAAVLLIITASAKEKLGESVWNFIAPNETLVVMYGRKTYL